MKKVLVLLCCFVMFFSSAIAETDLSNLSIDELRELQNQITEEIKTRNVNKMDFAALENEELIEVIYRAFNELCSREDFVESNVRETIEAVNRYLSNGVTIIFKTVNRGFYQFSISDNSFDLQFMTKLEKTLEEASKIKIGK